MEPDPPVIKDGRIIVPGTSRQLAVYGLFLPATAPKPPQRTVGAGSRAFTAKSWEPELLWISFDELCAPADPTVDYSLLPAAPELWVIDGVPAPEPSDSGLRAEAWEHFAGVLAVLARRRATLFVVGPGPMDWAAASLLADDARLRSAFADIGRFLAKLPQVESDEPEPVEGVSGC